jgi:O-antigen/teichoic acid export membrane protein
VKPSILSNINWYIVENVIRVGSGFFVGVWVARHLGPAEYGVLVYILSVAVLFTGLCKMGLDGVIAKDVATASDEEVNETLRAALWLRLAGTVTFSIFWVGWLLWWQPPPIIFMALTAMTVSEIPRAFECTESVLSAQMRGSDVALCKISYVLTLGMLRVTAILLDSDLKVFVWVCALEGVLIGLIYLVVSARNFNLLFRWPRIQVCWSLGARGLPLIFTLLFSLIYTRTDQIFLHYFLGPEAVGIYGVGIKLAEAIMFLPSIIMVATFPSLVRAQKEGGHLLILKLEKLYRYTFYSGVSVLFLFLLVGPAVLDILYGDDYQRSTEVLVWHALSLPFAFLAVVSSRWYLLNDLQWFQFFRGALTAALNIGINYYLVPTYGIYGAVASTFVSFLVAAIFYDAIFKVTRPLFFIKLRSIFFIPTKLKFIVS